MKSLTLKTLEEDKIGIERQLTALKERYAELSQLAAGAEAGVRQTEGMLMYVDKNIALITQEAEEKAYLEQLAEEGRISEEHQRAEEKKLADEKESQ